MVWLLWLSLGAQDTLSCDLHLYRYWRAPETTSVVGFLTVPLTGLTFRPDSGAVTQTAAYDMDVTLSDADGNVLHRERSTEHVTILRGRPSSDAETIANLAFDLLPGGYELRVAVIDSASGARAEARETIVTAGERPVVGALLLASAIRRLAADEVPPEGTLVRGGTIITPSLRSVVPADSALTLYTEVYPAPNQADTAAAVRVAVRDSSGAVRRESEPVLRRYPAGGGMELLRLSLNDLPPGDYSVAVRVEYPDTAVQAERSFKLQPRVMVPALRRPTDSSDRFDLWTESSLDSLFASAAYVATGAEKEIYPTLALEAKREFMDGFWKRRDPTPGPPNEFYEEYIRRVEYANREFQPRGTPTPGWSTPRGRIYILQGMPAERIVRQVMGRSGFDRPLEIWKYVAGRGDKYVFYDVTGNGLYTLLYTTNPDEPATPNWQDYLDGETVRFIERL